MKKNVFHHLCELVLKTADVHTTLNTTIYIVGLGDISISRVIVIVIPIIVPNEIIIMLNDYRNIAIESVHSFDRILKIKYLCIPAKRVCPQNV